MRRLYLIRAALLASASLAALSTPAHAQLGRLKKLGSDAIKEAAKAKAGLPEPGRTDGEAPVKKINAPITAERLDLVLASIKPYLAIAQARPQAEPAIRQYEAADSAASACLDAAGEKVDPMTYASRFIGPEYEARLKAQEKRSNELKAQYAAAEKRGDQRALMALRDTSMVIGRKAMMQAAPEALLAKCKIPYKPAAMLDLEAALEVARLAAGEGPSPMMAPPEDRNQLTPTLSARKAMTREEFGKLRERLAVWAISQGDPTLQQRLPKQFTAEEIELLTARNSELAALGALFKAGTLRWADWGDVSNW